MIEEIAKDRFREDKTLGYKYANIAQHVLANKSNKVYEHVYIMCRHINRPLYPYEVIHHIDRDRANNELNNLLLLTQSEHMALHQREDGHTVHIIKECLYCNAEINTTQAVNKIFCDSKCKGMFTRKFTVTPEELYKLVWEMPTTRVAELYGVSSNAIAARCKKFQIPKPPRGYWAKVAANKLC